MPGNDAIVSNEQLLDRAIRDAGALALEYHNSSAKSWNKADGSPVTEADMAVDEFLKAALLKDRPDYGWLSEETTDDLHRLSCDHVWIVDPIDGTRSFVERSGQWCISIALVKQGKPILAQVFRPLADDMYGAAIGGGATLNGQTIATSDCRQLENCKMMTRGRVIASEKWQKNWPPMQIDIAISLALRLCLVAEGRFDGTIALGNKCEWDLAAGDLIIREAGGKITNTEGEPMTYNNEDTRQPGGLIAAGPALHREILQQSRI